MRLGRATDKAVGKRKEKKRKERKKRKKGLGVRRRAIEIKGLRAEKSIN
jgi:hypothetical protein